MSDKYLGDMSTLTADIWNDSAVDQAICTVTSGTRPTGVEGRLIYETDTKRTLRYDGSSWLTVWQPWKSFTPTWSGITLGSSTQEAGYSIFAGTCYMAGKLTLGAGASVTGSVSMTSVPATVDTTRSTTYHPCGLTLMRVSGGGARYYGQVIDATDLQFNTWETSGTYTRQLVMNATRPFTWAVGDLLYWTVSYPTSD